MIGPAESLRDAVGLLREFRFTDRDFTTLRALARERAGINLTEAKRELVYSRLIRRLRQLKLRSFADYCRLLADDPAEVETFVNAITTNLTSFFREPHHFAFLRDTVIPQWHARAGAAEVLRVWCAGCSTGEEPYSIALTAVEALGPGAERVEILATDLDSHVLRTAIAGVYELERLAAVEPELLRRHFLKGRGANEGKAKVGAALKARVKFLRHNLVHQPAPGPHRFDAIICRNVVIYFDRAAQIEVYRKFAAALNPGGYLMVGHSESLFAKSERFRLVAQSTYRVAP